MVSRGQGSMKPSGQPTPKKGTGKQQPGKGERMEPGEKRGGTGLGFTAGLGPSCPLVLSGYTQAAENAFENIQHPRLIK